MTSTAVLYTQSVLELATSLARWPWDDTLPLKGAARSKSCGSTLELGLETDRYGAICRIGIKTHACAIGQAAAAIFAAAAPGCTAGDIASACTEIEQWLAASGDLPTWPGFDALLAARDYPARHGAIMLSWKAARDLLPSG